VVTVTASALGPVHGGQVLGEKVFVALLHGARGSDFALGELQDDDTTEIRRAPEVDHLDGAQHVLELVALELELFGEDGLQLLSRNLDLGFRRLLRSAALASALAAAASTARAVAATLFGGALRGRVRGGGVCRCFGRGLGGGFSCCFCGGFHRRFHRPLSRGRRSWDRSVALCVKKLVFQVEGGFEVKPREFRKSFHWLRIYPFARDSSSPCTILTDNIK
jgi:hypothetical protein